MKLTSLPQYTRNAKRFTEIVSVFVKYGFANWIRETDPEFIKGLFRSSQGVRLSELTPNARVRMALTELGPTFIKLGQIFSTRPDLIGLGLAKELSGLQADAPADSPDVVRATMESELGKPPEELFAAFEENPMASASIGQAHCATLHDGKEVVVKVQHKGIEKKVTTDLEILMTLAELAEKHDRNLCLYRPRTMVSEFQRTLLRELDFRREGRNLEEFALNFQGDTAVHIPKPYPALTARRVLTMEKLKGFSVADDKRLQEKGIDTKAFAERGARMYLDMIFRDSFYHADPHPGNIWVLPNGVIGLLDCGMVGRLDDQTREEVEGMLLSAIERDAAHLTEHVLRIGSVPHSFDRDGLRADISDFVAEYVGQSLKDFDLSGALHALTAIIRRHRIVLPAGISLLIKVLVMLEGTSRSLNQGIYLSFSKVNSPPNLIKESFPPRYTYQILQHSLNS